MRANLYTMGKYTNKYITPSYYKENEKKKGMPGCKEIYKCSVNKE
jgi:hypothetical protein